MNPKTIYKIAGVISILTGIMAAISLVNIRLIFFGLLFAIVGFIFSAINIFLNAKHEYTVGRFSIGYIGMIFSSLPVIYLLYLIFGNK